MSNLEIAANLMTAVCIFLAGRNDVHTWWTGIVACILFGVLFYSVQLYADAALQVFFIVTGVLGWVAWVRGDNNIERKIANLHPYMAVFAFCAAIAVSLAYGSILHNFTDAYAPFIDSTVLTFSVVAQILLMLRIKETWLVWLLVNTLSVPLFYSRELYLTSALYGVFWINAIVSWFHWQKLYREQ